VFTDSDINSSVSLSNIIIQGYNTSEGIDRTLYFDNLLVSSPDTQAVSAPATLSILLVGFIALFARTRLSVKAK